MEPEKTKNMTIIEKRMNAFCVLALLIEVMIIIQPEKIAKAINTSSRDVVSVAVIILLITIFTFLVIIPSDFCKETPLKPNKKDNITCIELEVQGRKYTITKELYNLLGKRGVPTLGEVRSLPPNPKRTSQVPTDIQHFIKDKENTTSRATPFPTKQETPKRANKESMREFIENHIQRMDDLDYISEEINKNKYPITPELKSLLRNGYRNKNLRKDFDDYIHNNPPEGFAPETFDLTKNTEAPRVNPIITDLINQIQTHGDNIIVKQQGQQLTIKATLNQEKKTQENQWGEF